MSDSLTKWRTMTETVLSSLNSALHRALATDDSVYIIGEDILDPYGGAFKVPAEYQQPSQIESSPPPSRKLAWWV
jgi:hypothetical protein